jgi:hypothetical protein
MSSGRDWDRHRQRGLRLRAGREERAEREEKAYLREREAARWAALPPRPSKADLRQEGASAVEAYLAKGGKIKSTTAPPWDDGAGWSPWQEVTPADRVPLLGDQFTATRNGRMWQRSRRREGAAAGDGKAAV